MVDVTLGPSIPFSTGWFITVELLRRTNLRPDFLAAQVDLPVDRFLEELDAWSRGPGIQYGISVDRVWQQVHTA